MARYKFYIVLYCIVLVNHKINQINHRSKFLTQLLNVCSRSFKASIWKH